VDYGYKITTKARRDLVGIWKYIAGDDASNASRFCLELLLAAESLQTFPYRHGTFAYRDGARKYPFRSYLILYEVDETSRTVEILRFWHAARDQRRLRLKEEAPAYGLSPQPVS